MTDLRTAALRALEALQTVFMPHHPAVIDLRAALAQPEDKSQAAFEHWVETVEATQGCAISRNAVADELLTVTPAQIAHAEAVEPATINHDYERGFVDGMNHQARSSVDRAVNAMAEPIIKPEIKGHNVKPPPEAQTEAEKIAYCAGWWAAMEAKRQWQSLTEEEVFHVENNVPDSVISDRQWTVYFARAIEAALRRKNHG